RRGAEAGRGRDHTVAQGGNDVNDSEFMERGGKVRVADGDAALGPRGAPSDEDAASSEATAPSSLRSAGALHKTPWPHTPVHQLAQNGTYFVTVGTYHKEQHFRGADRLQVLYRGLLTVAHDFGWQLEAWAVFSNHYHFVAHSPPIEEDASSLGPMLGQLHEKTCQVAEPPRCGTPSVGLAQLLGHTVDLRKVLSG